MMANHVLIIHTLCCLFMTGLIWMVQIVHYPTFRFVAVSEFTSFTRFHVNRITWIVAPVMILELITGAFLFLNHPFNKILMLNMGLLMGVWICTAVLSVPSHNRLQDKHCPKTIRFLVLGNWPRTLMWSLRTGLLAYLLLQLPTQEIL